MPDRDKQDEPKKRFTKGRMLLGAAGLFLFIVGVKRTLRTGDGAEYPTLPPEPEKPAS